MLKRLLFCVPSAGLLTRLSAAVRRHRRPPVNVEHLERRLLLTPVTITEFSNGITPGSALSDIAAGPDGNLWFTEHAGNRIGRITPTGTVTQFSTGLTANSGPNGITS